MTAPKNSVFSQQLDVRAGMTAAMLLSDDGTACIQASRAVRFQPPSISLTTYRDLLAFSAGKIPQKLFYGTH